MTHNILIADDDQVTLAILNKGLSGAGYNVIMASCGEEAIKLCIENEPDLVILDINMPGISGTETAHMIHTKTDVPIIFLSAYGDTDIVKQAVGEGAFGYLVKPIDVPNIIPTIEASLERSSEIKKLRNTEMHLSTALTSSRETSVAIGLIMERYHLSSEEAFEALRSHARSSRRKISEVAKDIINAAETVNMINDRSQINLFENRPSASTRG